MSKYFFCYSENLMKALSKSNVNYITVANHIKTGKTFWLYESCEEITKILDCWN